MRKGSWKFGGFSWQSRKSDDGDTQSGNGWINAHNVVVHGVPYAGIGKSGMGGGVVSPETLNDYLRPISVVRPL